MKRITLFSLALVIGFCLQAPSGFAQDQDQNPKDTKEAKGSSHEGKAKSQVAKDDRGTGGASHAVKGSTEAAQRVHKGSETSVTSRGDKSNGNASGNNTATTIQQTKRHESRQTGSPAFVVQGNQSNHYNGQWVAGNTHSDWGRNGYHQWNNHDYRWYDGGWLIIDAGYYQSGSIVREVKTSLAQDDRIGPRTRQAISNYESDNDLPGDGRINEPLLASLRLE
jgi:hypothetical protein